MKSKTRILSAVLTVAALAAAGGPAAAQADGSCTQVGCVTLALREACLANPSIPTCVNDAFDWAEWAVDTGRTTYNGTVQPAIDGGACAAYKLATGNDCPQLVPRI